MHYERTPLHVAIALGHAHLVPLLLDHGADPNAVDDEGRTPLQVAETELDEPHRAAVAPLLRNKI